jgi:outer membrane protein TolC
MKRLSWIALFLWTNAAVAGAFPGLPPDEVVRETLRAHPDAQAASSEIRYETANRERLEAGSYEWNLRLGGQQRKSSPSIGEREQFNEWNVALERPLRLPGKATTDVEIGTAGVLRAETALAQVIHESKRDLLQSWFAWLKENAAANQWAAQVDLLERQQRAVKRRQELGDASRLESIQTEATLALAKAESLQAASRQQAAREVLQRRYPGLPVTQPVSLGEPPAEIGDEAEWQAAVAEHSYELAMARQQTGLAMLTARRQRQDRLPDPSVGLAFSRERGGEEQVVGAYISIPLAGGGRRAAEAGAVALADSARYREDAIARRVALETATGVQSARAAYAAWLASRTAAERLQEAATMSGRAYQLGEGSLGEWLTSMRVANEAQLAARYSQLDALEKRYRLMLDARRLWQSASE